MDWLSVDGMKCDVLWLPAGGVTKLLVSLAEDTDQLETAAVLARSIQPVFDPASVLRDFVNACPEYMEERARRKAAPLFGNAHFFLCDWKVLETLIFRKDAIAYHKAEAEMVSGLVSALYAVNRSWQLDQRRLRLHADAFRILPHGFLDRLENMVLRRGVCQSLDRCHLELKGLFAELAVAANERCPAWRLPVQW